MNVAVRTIGFKIIAGILLSIVSTRLTVRAIFGTVDCRGKTPDTYFVSCNTVVYFAFNRPKKEGHMGLLDKVGSIIKTEGLEDAAIAKMHELIDSYKKVVAVLEPLGFTMGKFTIVMGVLPELHTAISGSIKDISEDGLKKLMDENKDDSMTVTLLKTLILTRKLWDHMDTKLTGVTVNLILGISPKISVDVN